MVQEFRIELNQPLGDGEPARFCVAGQAAPSWREKHVATLVANETVRSRPANGSASESVRVWLYKTFFSSMCGVTFRDWCEVLRDNRLAIDPRYWPKAAIITAGSVLNSIY